MQGIYRAFKRKEELDSTLMFTNNLQIWLSIFAFSAIIVNALWSAIGRLPMLEGLLKEIEGLPPFVFDFFFSFSMLMVLILLVSFLGLTFYSFYKLIKLLYHAKFGQKVPYDPKTIHDNFLAVIMPIEIGANLEECKVALSRLVKARDETRGKVRNEIEKRICEYVTIISKLETKNEDKYKTQ